MKKIVELVLKVGLMEPYNPQRVTDLGTIMIGIFEEIVKASDFHLSGNLEDITKGTECI